MNHLRKPSGAVAAALVLGLAVAGAATAGVVQVGSTSDTAPPSGPIRCEIRAKSAGGMIAIEGVVHADVPVSGTYAFRVAGSGGAGSNTIQQGGGFSAGPDGAATVGKVALGGAGTAYTARLAIIVGGKTVECSERVGGAI